MIYHITSRTQWEQAQTAGLYRGDTLDAEGFIHCSTSGQVAGVANARFRGRDDLVLLSIDPRKVAASIVYEGTAGGPQFPHIYGPLNLDAVTEVLPFAPGLDGTFAMPWQTQPD